MIDVSTLGKVVVLYGGDSAEREVSLNSGAAVLSALQGAGVDAIGFDPAKAPITDLLAMKVERAFIALHGRGGEDGTMQGALEVLGIKYTGSRVLGSALAMDKVRCKQIWHDLGLSTAPYRVVDSADYGDVDCAQVLAELGGVAMVKPACEGSSVGMAKVTNADELDKALALAFKYDQQVLVEQWITGAEYTVAILDQQPLPSIRMQTPNTFYDYQAKYQSNTTQYFCPSGLNAEEESEIAKLALSAYQAASVSGWGRVDIMRDSNGRFYLLEVNTSPGMTEKSLVPMAAKQAGMSFAELSVKILAGAH
ncbi:D-alanine--D-alanine ligase [Paraferrimonas sedimenticola]|uniref:D-alanine--D-alanine ligase n=1 Tax=Paraferrimonas sedimenticola TaxID=375674 RepID=A0AA37W285_9GAMM|nr:D-alanine--D-alanine ligase [Paraferrimonas sedimenticola]GLP97497.1 D-alanine--D-alanine ligase [Paraferrimonas sedimenticola]